MSIDCWIDTDAKDVLMVLRESASADDVAVVAGLSWIDVDDGHDTCGSGLDDDAAGLVELVRKDVFVVGQSDNELDDEFSRSRYNSTAGTPIGVLPSDAIVLLVETDDIGADLGITVGSRDDSVKVLSIIVSSIVECR